MTTIRDQHGVRQATAEIGNMLTSPFKSFNLTAVDPTSSRGSRAVDPDCGFDFEMDCNHEAAGGAFDSRFGYAQAGNFANVGMRP